jgi:GTP cyclohydrolase III
MNKDNIIKYFNTFKKSMIANKALEDFKGGDNAMFTVLQRNATRYNNDCDRIRADFSNADMEIYMSVKNAWDTYAKIFTK